MHKARILATTLVLAGALVLPALSQAGVFLDINVAPPPPQVEAPPPPPHEGYVWAAGYWSWDGGRHVWVPGHYIAPRRGYHWVPDHWDEREHGYHRTTGHWER